MPITKTNNKVNGLQQYRVRVNYTDFNGKYCQLEKIACGKAEAQALEKELQALAAQKTDSSSANMTFRDLYDEYMLAQKSEIRETTWTKTRKIAERVILPTLSNVRLDRLTVRQLQSWKSEIADRDLSILTKQDYYKCLNAILNFGVKRSYLPKNPLTIVGNFKDVYFKSAGEKIQFFTPEEFKKYILVAKGEAEDKKTLNAWGLYVFFSIAFYTGLRKGEIHALKWSDITGNILHVRRSIAQKLKGDDRETPPKNRASCRDLQMPKPLIEILEEHLERQKQDPGFNTDYRLCIGKGCIRDTTLENANKRFAQKAGVHHIRIHDFRHTHASLLINEGINIQEIARRLGHSDIEMTLNTYSHLYPREEERAIRVLDAITV